jgi:hypothetical protein
MDFTVASLKKKRRVGRARILLSGHLILQSRRKKDGLKGLHGAEMKKAYTSFLRRSIGSVGYLKSGAVKVCKAFNGHFSQYGSKYKIGRRKGSEGYSVKMPRQVGGVNQVINKYGETEANGALIRITRELGIQGDGNVGIHKGAKASATLAKPGLNPVAAATLSIGVANDQVGRVNSIYNAAMSQAMAGELREMQAHLGAVGQSVADEFNA